MRKGQKIILEKAAKILPENIKYLEDESKTIKELEKYYKVLQRVNFPISRKLLDILSKCTLRENFDITPELEKCSNKKEVYQAMSGISWGYTPNPDIDYYFLSLLNDLSDKKRVNTFLDFINKIMDSPKHMVNLEKAVFLFNSTDIKSPQKEDLENLNRYNPVISLYYNFSNKWIYPEKVKEVFNPEYHMSIEIPNKTVTMNYSEKAINITVSYYKEITNHASPMQTYNIHKIGDNYIRPTNFLNKIKLISFYNGGLYEVFKDKVIPLSLKRAKRYAEDDEDLKSFILAYLKNQKNYIARDLEKEIPAVPISINEALRYRSIKEMMTAHYGSLINWNRVDIESGYAVVKCLDRVTNPNILLDMLYKNKIEVPIYRNIRDLTEKLLSGIIIDKHKKQHMPGYSNAIIIQDYVRMCLDVKEKVNLSFSLKRIMQEHDLLADRIRIKSIPKIQIPKNSKFSKLKNIKELEWIRTKKRLAKESKEMKHCVASYAYKINRDECAICHIEKFGRPWTVEIGKNKKGLFIAQVQTIKNAPVDKREIEEYINSLL